ncbi:DUF418 domain-containing protein [Novosphingobium sp. KCTC 2891]|uniref:DUF418 domain-containing protein n=1 Tax=Novosphingobium sp. KCTC 2891 TaxID=2989730 RepID=UPI002221EB44|nr:DUF418 domain-containing protein [Novosphingobium sp. KCTC 2891]MCW1382976.1 DUF418 domain-containing protein [Novosphingobium sp. KCTC 2891]
MSAAAPIPSSPNRIAALDFVRGVAVLGILAINITGFWGPSLASFSPALPHADPGGVGWFALSFVVFEGKMRALFTLLFGASMMLFVEATERRGFNPDAMQARRLLWLAVFGYAHYLLLWWGDILFPYALCGLAALALRRLDPAALVVIGLTLFTVSHGMDSLGDLAGIAAEQRVLSGHGTPAEVAEQAGMMARIAASIADDTRILDAGFIEAIRLRLSIAPFLPFSTTLSTLTETLPLMLIGMALHRSGFFAGAWSERALRRVAACGIGTGGAITLALLAWLWMHGFPPRAMFAAMGDLSALPHLLMALGYAALLMLLWPKLAQLGAGRRLAAAGRCAFTNYLGTTVLMAGFFSGWGLGLGPDLPRAWLPAFVLLGWAAMLAWPEWWLARFAQGPLEAAWRRLTWLGAAR